VKLNLKINIDEPFSWDIINQFLVTSLSLSLIAALDRLAAELLGSDCCHMHSLGNTVTML
jgi:hypothetical protein